MLETTLNIMRITVLCLSLVVLVLSTMTGMLMNYLLVFLMLSAIAMAITVVVCIAKKQIHWKIKKLESIRTYLTTAVLRTATWLVIGGCIHIAVIPIQFSKDDFTNLLITLWGCVALLCLLAWIPRDRIGESLNITLCLFLSFLSFQLVMSYVPPSSAGNVDLKPFSKDDLYVFQGGNSALLNHHYFAGSQKYALDLIDPEDGRLPLEQQTDLKQYKTFGKPLYSPVKGVVVATQDSHPDQKIGESNYKNIVGNHVVIRIETDAYLLMAHLQENSVLISEGDTIQVGQPIARIGNSGNTTQPHLHIQVMTESDFSNKNSKPVPFTIQTNSGPSRSLRRNDIVSDH